mgnify:CR=1 FL=1
MKKQEFANPITEGIIWKQLLLFFFPILLGTFFQQLYNTADAMVVGQYVGKQALSAVGGTTGTLINLLVGFFVGLSSGATVIISQFYGARHLDRLSTAVHTAVAFSVAGGAALMIVGILLAPWALAAMDTPADVMDYAITYIRVYFVGMIPNLLYNMGAGILRAIGDSKRPLYYLIISCMTNIVLDFVFVLGFNLGVLGVGLGTVISQLISAVLVMNRLLRTDDVYRVELGKIRIVPKMLGRIVKIGIPAGLQSVMYSISNIIVQVGVNRLGTDVVAAWATYGKIDGLFWMMLGAMGISVTTFVGQNYGAGKSQRVRDGIRTCMIQSAVMTIVMSLLLYFTGIYIFRLFTSDGVVLETGVKLLHFMVPAFILYIPIEILSGSLRGVGDCWIPMIITCVGVCILRILWVLFIAPFYAEIRWIAFCYPLTWLITSVAFVLYYYRYSVLRRPKARTN